MADVHSMWLHAGLHCLQGSGGLGVCKNQLVHHADQLDAEVPMKFTKSDHIPKEA